MLGQFGGTLLLSPAPRFIVCAHLECKPPESTMSLQMNVVPSTVPGLLEAPQLLGQWILKEVRHYHPHLQRLRETNLFEGTQLEVTVSTKPSLPATRFHTQYHIYSLWWLHYIANTVTIIYLTDWHLSWQFFTVAELHKTLYLSLSISTNIS